MGGQGQERGRGVGLGRGNRAWTGFRGRRGHARVGYWRREVVRRTRGARFEGRVGRRTDGDRAQSAAGKADGVRPTISAGRRSPEVEVEFETLDDGLALPRIATTNDNGEASTGWVLGMAAGTQILRASVDSLSFDFHGDRKRATAGHSRRGTVERPLDRPVPRGAAGQGRRRTAVLVRGLRIVARRSGSGYDRGGFVGTPTEIDSTAFTVRVRDAEGSEAERAFGLRVCAAPIRIVPGEFVVDDPAAGSWCPPVLPAGAGRRPVSVCGGSDRRR